MLIYLQKTAYWADEKPLVYIRMQPVFTTENLYLRRFVHSDADSVLELNSDPLVTRFTHDTIYTREEAESVINHSIIPHYGMYGYGRWGGITTSGRQVHGLVRA